jgi:hypothetical protein
MSLYDKADPPYKRPLLSIDMITNNDGRLTKDGFTFTRTAIITGLTFKNATEEEAAIYYALTDQYDLLDGERIPQINDPHPALPSCRVNSIEASTFRDKSAIRLTIEYVEKIKTDTEFIYRSSLQEVESNYGFEENGSGTGAETFNDIVELPGISYTYKSGTKATWNPEITLTEDITTPGEVPTIDGVAPLDSLQVKQYYLIATGDDPDQPSDYETHFDTFFDLFNYMALYRGTINSAIYYNIPTHKMLVKEIEATNTNEYDQYGNTYVIVNYNIEINWLGFDVDIAYVDPYTSKSPSDVFDDVEQPNAAYSRFNDNGAIQKYPSLDFGSTSGNTGYDGKKYIFKVDFGELFGAT